MPCDECKNQQSEGKIYCAFCGSQLNTQNSEYPLLPTHVSFENAPNRSRFIIRNKKQLLVIVAIIIVVCLPIWYFVFGFNTCDICDKMPARNHVSAVTEWDLCDKCYSTFKTNSSNSSTYIPENPTSSNGSSRTFTNKYGTTSTKCAHPGCSNFIASSGDTNCCATHSRRCQECNCYIDEDAMYCMDCIQNALS